MCSFFEDIYIYRCEVKKKWTDRCIMIHLVEIVVLCYCQMNIYAYIRCCCQCS